MRHLRKISQKFNIIYFGDHWDEYLRRRQQIVKRLSKFESIDKIVYVVLPLTVFSFLKYLSGQSDPKVTQAWKRVLKNGLLCKRNGVWILTPITLLPYIPVKIIQDINNCINYWMELLVLKYYIKKLKLWDSILWITHPFAADIMGKLGGNKICYDRTEDFAYKHDCTPMLQGHVSKNDRKILEKADLIFVQTKEMLEEISFRKKETYLSPNAVDISWYNKETVDTADMHDIPYPILGYCGNINSRIDFELLHFVVSKHPEWSLVMIGHLGPGIDGASLLREYKNVYFLGAKPYRELPSYFKKCDVFLIPHKIDKFTESQSPLKLFDYLAAGKPVVSTNIAGVREYKNIVKIGYTKEEFVSLIGEALFNDSEKEINERLAIAQQNAWDIRVRDIYNILEVQFQ